jgi:hypothetical protein
LIQLCQGAGAKRVVIDGLDFAQLGKSTVARFIDNPDRISFGGLEDE